MTSAGIAKIIYLLFINWEQLGAGLCWLVIASDGFCLLQPTFSADYEMKVAPTDLIFSNLS